MYDATEVPKPHFSQHQHCGVKGTTTGQNSLCLTWRLLQSSPEELKSQLQSRPLHLPVLWGYEQSCTLRKRQCYKNTASVWRQQGVIVLKTLWEVCGTDTLSHCHFLCSSTHIPLMAALSLMVMGVTIGYLLLTVQKKTTLWWTREQRGDSETGQEFCIQGTAKRDILTHHLESQTSLQPANNLICWRCLPAMAMCPFLPKAYGSVSPGTPVNSEQENHSHAAIWNTILPQEFCQRNFQISEPKGRIWHMRTNTHKTLLPV